MPLLPAEYLLTIDLKLASPDVAVIAAPNLSQVSIVKSPVPKLNAEESGTDTKLDPLKYILEFPY